MPSPDLFEDESPDIEEELAVVIANVSTWLNEPNSLFGGARPAEFLNTPEGRERLRDMIRRIKHGMHA